jgi:hypothetical protein
MASICIQKRLCKSRWIAFKLPNQRRVLNLFWLYFNILDAFHGSDQRYFILGRDQGHYFEMNQDDKEMESLMVEAFTSFVKTGLLQLLIMF